MSVTLERIAEHLAGVLTEALGERWTIAYSGVPDPQEAWLHGPEFDAAAVGVFVARVIVWLGEQPREFSIATRDELLACNEGIIAAVREQLAAYRENIESSERVRAHANELARKLGARFRKACRVEVCSRPTHWRASEARVLDKSDTLARVFARDGKIWVHAGVMGERGWEGLAGDAALEAIVAAVARASRTLTIDRLIPGQRYRVIRSIDQLHEGMIVRYIGINDVDNHYGIGEFEGPDGQTLGVHGDYSTRSASPLGPAYRYLEPLED